MSQRRILCNCSSFAPLLIAFASIHHHSYLYCISPLYPQSCCDCSSHCIPTFASPVASHFYSLHSPVLCTLNFVAVFPSVIPLLHQSFVLSNASHLQYSLRSYLCSLHSPVLREWFTVISYFYSKHFD